MESITDHGKMIAQGNTAEIYEMEGGRILKLFREGIAPAAIQREYELSRVAARALQEVPKVYGLVETDGRQGIVFQRVSGDDMLGRMLERPTRLKNRIRDFAAYHAKTHVPVPEEIRTVAEKLKDEIGWEKDLSDGEKARVLQYLSHLPGGDCLCHGDFHPGNVMISGEGVYFLDWMTAGKGDPCADAARTWLLLKYGEPMHADKRTLIKARVVMAAGSRMYLKAYCRLTGAEKKQIKRWAVPVAAARLSEWLTDHERRRLLRLIRRKLP